VKTERRKPRNDEALRVLQGSEADERQMEMPLQAGWIHPEPVLRELPSLHADHLVEDQIPEVEAEMMWLWIVLAVLFIVWILKTM